MDSTLSFEVKGMTCNGCTRAVHRALESVPGVSVDRVALGEPVAIRFSADSDRTAVAKAVTDAVTGAGYHPVLDPVPGS